MPDLTSRPKQGPKYFWRPDGSGRIEWDNLEQLAQVDLGFALQMAQTMRDTGLEDARPDHVGFLWDLLHRLNGKEIQPPPEDAPALHRIVWQALEGALYARPAK